MTCTLYGQVDIELSGTKEIEVVLEGELSAVQLKGEIDIELDSNENIYLSSIINHPKLNAELGLVVNLDGCLTTESTYINAIAKPCCNGDAITVQVLETNQPTVNTILNNYSGHGFIYNGECYQFTSVGGGGVPVDTVLPSDYFLSICTNSICPECTTPTPTITPTPTPTSTTTPTPTPTLTRTQTPTPTPSSSQTSCVEFELEWSFSDSDACNGVGLSTNTYYTSSPFTVGNTLYQNDTCTTSVSGGRYVIYNSNVYYINNGTIENHTC